jgi:hypothetical protein
MLTASIQVGSEKIGSCTGMLGNTYIKMSSNHTHCQCGKFFTPISLSTNTNHPLSALSRLFCVSNLITRSTTSSVKWIQSVKEDFSSAYTGTWCVLSLPDNAAAVYRQVMFKPTLRDKESTIMKDCRLPGMLTPFSPPKKLDLCIMGWTIKRLLLTSLLLVRSPDEFRSINFKTPPACCF